MLRQLSADPSSPEPAPARARRMVQLHCHAPSRLPGAKEDDRCGGVLGVVLGPVRFVGCAAKGPRLDGRKWLKCARRDCKTWNIFLPLDETEPYRP